MTSASFERTSEATKVHLDISSDGGVETPFGSHLLKDALVLLIEEAPVDHWAKDETELMPEEFWAAILAAVTRSYLNELPEEMSEINLADALAQLLSELRENEFI